MAKLSKPPIPLKLYKHFAMATLALTATIAMFADSDQREARAEQAGIEEEPVTVAEAADKVEAQAPRLIGAEEVRTRGSFGDEGGGSYGAPTVSSWGTGGSADYARAEPAGRISVRGYDQAWIDAMSETEYRAFLEALPPEMRNGESDADRARNFQRATESRSGHRGGNGDAPA
ncbi:hypothetical protein [Aurantiacibacter sp. D1-12]|uniref:hypothetical protein n=1 Tax=Aurantiacibacter sp. D1-12 TaxID=2993658 RepID=UPI00237C9E9C|nr:hypothetical protein [Aurantiacibacter sp. D1-12]MDE1466860.1 hypothetical protein [Aurantiacibacter sp. D1-12]